jgi:cyclophilin family peptidyl-prolyl cis-trans isomerase
MEMILGPAQAPVGVVLRAAPVIAAIQSGRFRLPARFAIIGWLVLIAICGSRSVPEAAASKYARLDYNVYTGSIYRHTVFLELFDDRPITTGNFLQYVNGNKYDGMIMHRYVSNFVLQGGGFYPSIISEPQLPFPYSLNPNATVDLDGNPATQNPTIAGEAGNPPPRPNVKGTVAMALSSGPNTGTSQWFINLTNNSASLDGTNNGGPFTVFAQLAGDGTAFIDSLLTHVDIVNMNPDTNDDGMRESFYPFGETPLYFDQAANSYDVVQVADANQIDYLGTGLTTTVPAGGLAFTARDAFIDTGTLFNGAIDGLTVAHGRTLGIREGYSLGRTLTNDGIVAPGLQIGNATVANYVQPSDGTLEIELAGSTASTQYDRLVVTGSAFVAGKLDVSFVNGYSPTVNTTFTVLTANQITGTFTTFDLPQLTPGFVWSISRTATAYNLTVAAGDYDRNGVVDAADYVLWRKTRNATVTAYSGADGNGNGLIDAGDYTIWRNNLGNLRGIASGSGSGSLAGAGVPEPTSAFLMLCGSLLFGVLPRRRADRS